MKEKQYLISEEDLDKLIETPASLNTYEWVADIKSKQPVSTLDRDRVLNEMKELISKYMTTLDGDMADEDMVYVVMEEFATPNKLAEDLADAICSLAVQPVENKSNWKYRRKVICNNCGILQDFEFNYGTEISDIECMRCGCKALQLEGNSRMVKKNKTADAICKKGVKE